LTHLEGPLLNLSSHLFYLDLHQNKLQGPIPVFPRITCYLDLSSNNFSSIIPRDFGNYLSFTSFLSLSNNTLSGSILDSLSNALYLEVLDLSSNNISETIPSCLMTVSENLGVLNLKNNNLSSPIPNTIIVSCGLWTLYLRGNQLDGPIPKSLAYCSKLEVLDLGSNQIIAGFPCFLKGSYPRFVSWFWGTKNFKVPQQIWHCTITIIDRKQKKKLTNDLLIALLVSSFASWYISQKNLFNAASPSSFSSFSWNEVLGQGNHVYQPIKNKNILYMYN